MIAPAQLSGRQVAVVGDVMLDQFIVGRVDRISPEAPVPIVCFDREEFRLGGAANVTHNILALGSHAHLIGIVGEDGSAAELRRRLEAAGLDDGGLVPDASRPTTRKMRIVTTRNQQVARVDEERDTEPTGPVLAALCRHVTASGARSDALVLSDYRKGVVCADVIAAAAAAASTRGLPLLVDPKILARVPAPGRRRRNRRAGEGHAPAARRSPACLQPRRLSDRRHRLG
jgi:D-beta-D-heptose 7-phosphate kinase/D-beta-D-heptose 1-phosphate adenosyltransferase